MTEKQIVKQLKKIKYLRGQLRAEKAKFGCYDDSNGKRYSIAELYFEIQDHNKTNLYLNWFYKNFPGDGTYPYFQFNSAICYFKAKNIKAAHLSIIDLNCQNFYLIELLISKVSKDHDKFEWTESESLQWANENIESYRKLLTEDFSDWLAKITLEKNYIKKKREYISILKLLKYTKDQSERQKLFTAKSECLKEWRSLIT